MRAAYYLIRERRAHHSCPSLSSSLLAFFARIFFAYPVSTRVTHSVVMP